MGVTKCKIVDLDRKSIEAAAAAVLKDQCCKYEGPEYDVDEKQYTAKFEYPDGDKCSLWTAVCRCINEERLGLEPLRPLDGDEGLASFGREHPQYHYMIGSLAVLCRVKDDAQ